MRALLRRHLALTALVAAAILSGCAASPKVNFYTLSAPSYPEAHKDGSFRPSIVLGPVTLPETVDRPQLVVRTGENQVEIAEARRWAQPLKDEAARVLAANLAHHMDTLKVSLYGQGAVGEPDIRVAVDILRFDSRLGSNVTIEALWTIRRKGSSAPLAGHSIVNETVQGDDYASLPAAHGRALARISKGIA